MKIYFFYMGEQKIFNVRVFAIFPYKNLQQTFLSELIYTISPSNMLSTN